VLRIAKLGLGQQKVVQRRDITLSESIPLRESILMRSHHQGSILLERIAEHSVCNVACGTSITNFRLLLLSFNLCM
jgi:hypothetical protein